MSSTPNTPSACPSYPQGCECVDCSNREVWAIAQGLSVSAARQNAKAKAKATVTNHWTAPYGMFGSVGDAPPPPPPPPKEEKLPPMNCTWCSHRNEYVGKEHLVLGQYVCRSCRPRLGLKVVGT